MKKLTRKLLRDIATLRWQLASIALVVASGVAVLVAALGTFRSLEHARERFYASAAFPDVFVRLTSAPGSVADALARLDGVAGVQSRLTFDVPIDLEGVRAPIVGRVLSLPARGSVARQRLVLVSGRLPEEGERDEVAVNEAFAIARHLQPGDSLPTVLNGRREELTIVGTVLSAEHLAALRAGEVIPDDRHFGVLFVSHEALATAYERRGTFNDAVLWLSPGAEPRTVIGAVDRVLAPYGGYGAFDRTEQPAHRFVDGELRELEVEATVLPVIFLVVAAFLLNIVLARIVAAERTQIATLRALGFRKGPVIRHYLALASFVAGTGSLVGVALGILMGIGMTAGYRPFFRFPDLAFEVEIWVIVVAVATGLVAAMLGALGSARRIASLAPAEAMRSPTPRAFHMTWLDRLGLARHLTPSLRLVVRNVSARPARTATAIVGVSGAIGILVVGAFWNDALDALLDHQFRRVMREDVTVTFVTPVHDRAIRELAHVPGVRLAEGALAVPVRLSAGLREKRVALLGLSAGSTLRRLVKDDGSEMELPPEGLVLSSNLADRLDVVAGAQLVMEVLEGERFRRVVRVSSVIDEPVGMSAYMRADAMARLLDQGASVSLVFLALEPGREAAAHAAFRRLPAVASVAVKRSIVQRFESTLMSIVLVFSAVLTLLGALVVVGVVYNTARILIAEREGEFATLRVLGFTRANVSEAFLLELAAQIVPSLGVGALFGYGLSAVAVRLFGPEDLSIPLVVGPRTWAVALAVVLISAATSALLVRRRIDRLDLVSLLKVRE